jgi:hypothetical protein
MGISYSGFDTRTDEEKQKNPDAPTGGTTTVNAAYNGSESEQATRATIGAGTVTVKDGTEVTANRDLDKAQEVTMEHTIGGLNANLTVDTRMFSEEGRNSIKTDFADTYLHADEIAEAVTDVATNDDVGILDFGDRVQTYAEKREVDKQNAANATLHDKLQGKEGADGNQEGMQSAVNGYNEAQGVENSAEVNLYDGSRTPDDTPVMSNNDFNKEESNSGYHAEENNIYMNTDKINMTDSGEQIEAASHEQARNRMASEGSTLSEQTQTNLATSEGQQSRQAFELYSGINGYETSSTPEAASMWKVMNQGSDTIARGTEKISKVDSGEIEPLTIFVHGTYSNSKSADKDFIKAVGDTYNEDVVLFDWSGKNGIDGNGEGSAENSKDARTGGAQQLNEMIENYQFADGEQLNIVAHSHGGNVVKEFTQIYDGEKKIDNATFLGTPVRDDYRLNQNAFSDDAQINNVYDSSDVVQRVGGIDTGGNNGSFGLAEQTIDTIQYSQVNNIRVETPNPGTTLNPISVSNVYEQTVGDHTNMDSKEVWEQVNGK